MHELLSGQSGETVVAILMAGLGIVAVSGGITIAGWKLWLKHRLDELQVELKRDMVAAGMSADEIVRVLEAGGQSGVESLRGKRG
jgi:hypothetical protein